MLADPPFGKKSSVTIIGEGGVVEGIANYQPLRIEPNTPTADTQAVEQLKQRQKQ